MSYFAAHRTSVLRITMLSGQSTAQAIFVLFSSMKAIAAPHRGFSNYPRDLLCLALSRAPDPRCGAPATE
jgi:hypothetical protein